MSQGEDQQAFKFSLRRVQRDPHAAARTVNSKPRNYKADNVKPKTQDAYCKPSRPSIPQSCTESIIHLVEDFRTCVSICIPLPESPDP